jgi:hypothetical protein
MRRDRKKKNGQNAGEQESPKLHAGTFRTTVPRHRARKAAPFSDCLDSVVNLIWTGPKLNACARGRRYTWWSLADFLQLNYEFLPCSRGFLDRLPDAPYTRFTTPMPVDEPLFAAPLLGDHPLQRKNEGAG